VIDKGLSSSYRYRVDNLWLEGEYTRALRVNVDRIGVVVMEWGRMTGIKLYKRDVA